MAVQQLTLNQTVKLIRDIALSHDQINTVYFGDVWEFLAQTDNTYPAMFYSLTGSQISGKNLAMDFSLFFLDRQLQDESNETDVLSDQLLIGQDIFSMMRYPKFDWKLDEDVSIEFFTENEKDYLSGVKLDITINYPMLTDRCQIPDDYTYPEWIGSGSGASGGSINYIKFLLDYPTYADFPTIGEVGKIYVTNDTNKLYRFVDSAYIEISPTTSTSWGSITGNITNQTDLQNALNTKAPLASPTFTGTVSGITKSMVGLGNIDNTSDVNKPISSATQTALNAKYDTSNPSGFITSSALSNYVPYTGASQNLNLGSKNLIVNNIFDGFSSITASGTQIVLTIDSVSSYLVNGSGGQTFKLPNATTIPNGAVYIFNNNQSSGAITINNNSNTLVVSVPSGGYAQVELLDNTSAAGTWDRHFQAPSNVSWSTNTFDYAGSITSATWNGNVVAINRGGTGASTASGALTNLGGIGLTALSGTAPITYNNTTGAIGIAQATTTTNGYLSSTDWNTFNGKQAALTNPITGTGTINYVPKFTGTSAIGNSLIYDNGTNVTINGTAGTGLFNVTGSITASSAIARGVNYTPTLVASANSDVLVGLDINPTFTNGAFTGVSNIGLRVKGDIIPTFNDVYNLGTFTSEFLTVWGQTFRGITRLDLRCGVGSDMSFNNSSILMAQFKGTTGNFILQNGGTFTDAGYRLDVFGLTRFTGTTASDTAPLGAELAAVTGTGTNWTLAGTNLNVGGYTHTVGSIVPLTTSLAAVSGTYYQITYTITGRTAGSIQIDFGGTSTSTTATGATGPLSSSTAVLTITPTTDFDGTVVLSIKSIGTSSASSIFANSAGTESIGIRASSIISNTFIGQNAGRRNTTGQNNTFISYQAGQSNTTGQANTFVGQAAGQNTSIGNTNTFLGAGAGQNNTTGGSNTFIGASAGSGNSTATNNIAIGVNTFLANTTGTQNIIIGNQTYSTNTATSSNVIVGFQSLSGITTGGSNTTLGNQAGRFIADGITQTTSFTNGILIGASTKPLSQGNDNSIVIGINSTGLGSNTTVLGNSSTVTTAIYGNLLLGTTSTTASALLSMSSTTKGFLPPVMTTTQKNAISSPATGLVVFDSTLGKLCVFSTTWQTITSI